LKLTCPKPWMPALITVGHTMVDERLHISREELHLFWSSTANHRRFLWSFDPQNVVLYSSSSFRRQKYQPHYILMEFVCLACAWTIKSMGVRHSQKEDRVKNLHSGPKWFIYFLNLEFSLPIDTKKINLIRSKCNQIHSSQHLKCFFCVIHDYLVSKEQVLRTSTNKFWKIGFKMYLKNSC
jgi:hypothetical protein